MEKNSGALEKVKAMPEGSPGRIYLARKEAIPRNLFFMGLGGTVISLFTQVLDGKNPNAHPIISPSRLLIDSMSLVVVPPIVAAWTGARNVRRLERLETQGVDIAAMNQSLKERLKVHGRSVASLAIALSSVAIAGSIESNSSTPTESTGNPPSLFQVVPPKLARHNYVDRNGTTAMEIGCAVNPTSDLKSFVVDESRTVLPSNPEVFKLDKSVHSKAEAYNYVFVSEVDYEEASSVREDSMYITLHGNTVKVAGAADQSISSDYNGNTMPAPYKGKNSPNGSYSFKASGLYTEVYTEGSFGITDWEVLRQGNNYYLGLACNVSNLTQ